MNCCLFQLKWQSVTCRGSGISPIHEWWAIITTRNFVFCNLSYATKKCRMQLHMLHATPK
jgi:hypothetical protein